MSPPEVTYIIANKKPFLYGIVRHGQHWGRAVPERQNGNLRKLLLRSPLLNADDRHVLAVTHKQIPANKYAMPVPTMAQLCSLRFSRKRGPYTPNQQGFSVFSGPNTPRKYMACIVVSAAVTPEPAQGWPMQGTIQACRAIQTCTGRTRHALYRSHTLDQRPQNC